MLWAEAALLAFAIFAMAGPGRAQESTQPAPAIEKTQPAPLDSTPAESSVPADRPAALEDTPQASSPGEAKPAVPPADASDAASSPATSPAELPASPTESASTHDPVLTPAPTVKSKSPALPHDLSPWGMFMAADIVVKVVMVGLAAASFITWTIWAAKAFELWTAKRRLKRAIRQIASAQSLSAAIEMFVRTRGTGAALVREAGEEVARSVSLIERADGDGAKAGVKERVTSRLSRVEANAGRRMTLGTGVLATIGATAPFVGLFGTVWGIMNSFIGISQSQTTNLAVVAPGIAEALLATAIGLVAAIPAVIIYNVFARSIAGYRLLLSDASAGVERLVSWELDARRQPSDALLARAAE
jgi:biopolymer transport protein ExbB